MRKLVIWLAVPILLVALAWPVGAGTTDVSIVGISGGFDPKVVTVAAGGTVRWTNEDSIAHTSTQSGSLGLWSSGSLGSGGAFSVTLAAAGTYPYRCNIHPSQMTGTVRVPVVASPATGGLDTVFVIRVASQKAGEGFVYDVQRKRNDGAWKLWKEGISKRAVKFDPRAEGRYAFRARLRSDSGGASGWSPVARVVVS